MGKAYAIWRPVAPAALAGSVTAVRHGRPVTRMIWPIPRAIKARAKTLSFKADASGTIQADDNNANYGAENDRHNRPYNGLSAFHLNYITPLPSDP